MSVEGQEAMQQVVQDAMAGMSADARGQGAGEDGLGEDSSPRRGGPGEAGVMGGGVGGGAVDGVGDGGRGGDSEGSLLSTREQREEEWSLKMAEAEDAMVG